MDLTPPDGSERTPARAGAFRLVQPVDVTGNVSLNMGADNMCARATVVIADRSLRSAARAGNIDNPGPSKSMTKSIG